jgi:hypothetical protein
MNDVKGERIGIFEIVYNPVKKGLPATIEKIIFESNEINYNICLILAKEGNLGNIKIEKSICD